MKFSSSAQNMRSSEIRNLMKFAANPDIISFAGGMPNNDLFPIDEIDEIYNNLPKAVKQAGFQYGPTGGYPPLLDSLKDYLRQKGLPVDENGLIITTGCQQALNIISKLFIDPGDTIITEDPCFIGAIAAFKSYQAQPVCIPLDDDGMKISELEKAFAGLPTLPKMVYITPYFHNPAGIIYSHDRKQAIIDFLQHHNIVLLEDDPYGELYFNEHAKELTVPIKILAKESFPVCYAGSFSKMIGPGLRLGWLLAPPEIYEKAELAKQSLDACSSTLPQILANEFLVQNKLEGYLKKLRKAYVRRAQIMLDSLAANMPEGITWTTPQGGFYIWVTMPDHIDATDLLKKTLDKGAVFVIGRAFDPHDKKNNCFRLAFSHTPEDKISNGVEIIASALKEML